MPFPLKKIIGWAIVHDLPKDVLECGHMKPMGSRQTLPSTVSGIRTMVNRRPKKRTCTECPHSEVLVNLRREIGRALYDLESLKLRVQQEIQRRASR